MPSRKSASNEGARSEAAIYADIEAFQQLGDIENWSDRRSEAELLLQEWLDLPDDIPDDQDLAPFDPRAEWLWDQLEPLEPIDSALPVEQDLVPDPFVVDVDHWVHEVTELLKDGWQQFDRFLFRCDDGVKTDGDLAARASFLWMEFEFIDPDVKRQRLPELVFLWSELESHIDPNGSMHEGRQQMRNEKRAKELEKQGKHREAALWLLPKDQWERPKECSEKEWANIIKPFNRKELLEPLEEFLARVELARAGLLPRGDTSAVRVLKDWERRGRPNADAPLIRLNGQLIQADVGQMLRNGLEKIQGSGLGGSDLTASLLTLAVNTGQPFHSIRKAWDEFCGGMLDREIFTTVLDEMLTGDEPMVDVEELAGPEFQRMVIDDFQRQFECDPMLVLLTVMAAMGTVLPLRTSVRGLSHTQHLRPGVLFVMILVVSGGMKSMLSDELVEKPIVAGRVGWEVKYYARKARAALAALKTNAAMSHQNFTSAPAWMQEWANITGSESPDELRHVVSDFTGEGIDRNAMNNDAFPGYQIGFLLTTDEGRQLMGGDRYKSGAKGSAGSKYTLDKLKRAWDGKGPASVRGDKGRERNYERIRLGILAFIQPEIYDEIASDETDDACGFWPRFLAYEAAPVQLREGLTPMERREIAQNSTFRNYLDELYGSIYSLHLIPLLLKQQVQFKFSEAAEDWWYPIQCQIGRESARETQSGDGVMGRLLGKLPALVVDVALLLHLLKLKGANELNADLLGDAAASEADVVDLFESLQLHLTIPQETVQGAYKLCRQLMLRTAKQRNRAQGDGSGDRARFLVKVQATAMKYDPEQKGLAVGQLQRGWNGDYLKKHPQTKDLIYQALGALADRGLGELTLTSSNNHGGFRYRWTQPVAG